jgi:hypothetical protein
MDVAARRDPRQSPLKTRNPQGLKQSRGAALSTDQPASAVAASKRVLVGIDRISSGKFAAVCVTDFRDEPVRVVTAQFHGTPTHGEFSV